MNSISVENISETNNAVLEDSVMARLGFNTTHCEARLSKGESRD